MPYITPELRKNFSHLGIGLVSGELNYQITQVCNSYLKLHGGSYTRMNEIIGALECAKLEFYRRICAPYENDKIEENGDVY